MRVCLSLACAAGAAQVVLPCRECICNLAAKYQLQRKQRMAQTQAGGTNYPHCCSCWCDDAHRHGGNMTEVTGDDEGGDGLQITESVSRAGPRVSGAIRGGTEGPLCDKEKGEGGSTAPMGWTQAKALAGDAGGDSRQRQEDDRLPLMCVDVGVSQSSSGHSQGQGQGQGPGGHGHEHVHGHGEGQVDLLPSRRLVALLLAATCFALSGQILSPPGPRLFSIVPPTCQ